MKGISHFTMGVAVAACFPQAVQAGAAGNPLYFLLGGICGLLPDTLDFKLGRFFYRHDIEVTPDPLSPDVQLIADAIAHAINSACRTGKAVRIKLNTIRLAADLWQSYTVLFDVTDRRVCVRCGPQVDTGAQPVEDTSASTQKQASAALACGIQLDYSAAITVDIFDGPVFQMTPLPDGKVRAVFQPWHRLWSHGIPAAALVGLGLLGAAGTTAALVGTLAWSAHVLADQLGFMGSAVAFPFVHRRAEGWKMTHSTDAGPSLVAVWMSALVVYWRLYAHTHPDADPLFFLPLLLFGFVVPGLLYRGANRMLRHYGIGERSTR